MANEVWTPIYTIVLFRTIEEISIKKTNGNGTVIEQDSGFVTLGDWDIVGFLHDKEDALESVKANACDMYEACFDYAIVEEIHPGIYAMDSNRWYFKFNRETRKYVQIEEPEILKSKNHPWGHMIGFKRDEEQW